ncbi:uncharacterized protein LOC9637936 [Selaginella moellendorffii]|uniref:uncharacterized protein LOC9637936 n=1 Tax=Selaginella moellendorffii TaxID=88036 RepID=UPI000D1CABA7|nr:uncharacterized protein LOC9637936 [Selaginella moellendorffii]|eukprot:XP_024534049.1 uncharacterized protein LOC9637936 [Selaginella moellendorffii]
MASCIAFGFSASSVSRRNPIARAIASPSRRQVIAFHLGLGLCCRGGLELVAALAADGSTGRVAAMIPPVAPRLKQEFELFGDSREDFYFWLRDDKRADQKVLDHLKAENAYTEQVMADTKKFEEEIFAEMKGRIKEDDTSVPVRDGPYFYYEKELEGKQYKVHCRRKIPGGEGPGSIDEIMDEAQEEEVLLDENEKAASHKFYTVGDVQVSPDHTRLAYTEDTKGDEIFSIYVVDIASKQLLGPVLKGAVEDIKWIDNESIAYVTQDDIHRPYKAWYHKIGNEQSEDVCLYHEEDETCFLDMGSSESKEYTFVHSGTKTTSFVLYLENKSPVKELKYLTPRVEGVDTSASHRGEHFFITKRTDDTYNSELYVCPVNDVSSTTLVLPHRPSVKLEEVQAARDHLVVYERENALQSITVFKLPPAGEPITSLDQGVRIKFPEAAYALSPKEFQFNSPILRYQYSSLSTPFSVYDYDMETGKSMLKKRQEVLGGFQPEKYVTLRKWATAQDGTQVPISMVYRKDLAKLDGSDPLLLYGYGSYEVCIDPDFRMHRLSLIDRGVTFAIAHIRGGGELGRKWYEDGKLTKKMNTFEDFICCGEYLIANKFCAKDKLCIQGRSAGGLLIGAALTMRPDLYRCAVAEVPFVDVLTTMLDSSIPLTTAEWEEWGDPRKKDDYLYMKSYSPVDNVLPREYPDILVTGGLHDSRVAYWEPAKFVAKLRENKTDKNLLLFKCDFGAGHSSMSGRFDKLKDLALSYTFILRSLGLATRSTSSL